MILVGFFGGPVVGGQSAEQRQVLFRADTFFKRRKERVEIQSKAVGKKKAGNVPAPMEIMLMMLVLTIRFTDPIAFSCSDSAAVTDCLPFPA